MGSTSGFTTGSKRPEDPPSVELRASVLDAAISIGFRNSVMARWMYEDSSHAAERSNPGLMSPTATSVSSHSASTSDESSMSPYIGRFRPTPSSPENSKPGFGRITEQNIEYSTNVGLEELPPFSNLTRIGAKPEAAASKVSFDDRLKEKRVRKQKSGYDSDAGYISEGESGKKAGSRPLWRRKDSGNSASPNGTAHDFDESDGGYLSEAVATGKSWRGRGKSKKEKAQGKREEDGAVPRTTDSSPTDSGDPEAFLAKINASLTHSSSNSPSSPVNASNLLPSGGRSQPDGYTTDSGTTSRGRSTAISSKKSKKAQGNAPEDENMRAPPKKSFFRIVSRSVSRDRDKDKSRRARETATPPPVPPMPVVLPIAERFTRLGAGTPQDTIPGTDTKFVTAEGLNVPSGLQVPPPSTPALSVSSSFVDLTPPAVRCESPANLSPSMDGAGGPSLTPPSMGAARPAGPRMSLNYGQFKSAPNGKALGLPVAAKSLDMPRERVGDVDGRSASALGTRHTEAKGSLITAERDIQQPKAEEVKEKDREKKIRKGMGIFTATGALFALNKPSPSPASAPAISAPNAHFLNDTRPTDAKDIVEALNAKRVGSTGVPESEDVVRTLSPSYPSPSSTSTPALGDSYESDSYFHYSSHPYSSSSLSTPADSPSSLKPGMSAASSSIASRRAASSRAFPIPLVIDVPGDDVATRKGSVTPTQSRSETPTIEVPPNNHNEELDFVPASPRASVLAYYNVPPPSPPPKGPLPPPPPDPSARRAPDSSLSPNRAFVHASRSPSPLRSFTPPVTSLHARMGIPSRSPSPGLQAQMNVKRGKESPFPMRPVLPPQDRRDLVERVERYKTLYAAENASPNNAEGEWGENDDWRDAEVEDAYVYADAGVNVEHEFDGRDETRTSMYIRAARARGEKRVYFVSPPQSADTEGTFLDSQPDDEGRIRVEMVPVVEEVEEQSRPGENVDEAHLRPRASAENEGEGDRRSVASASIYSRYSVLDEESSAQTREGFMKSVREWEKEDVPDVPEIPDEFKRPKAEAKADKPAMDWRAQLKPTSSRFRF